MATDPGTAVFNLHRDGGDITAQLDVTYTVFGTADGGPDYASLPLLVTFFPSITDVTISIDPVDDSLVEGDETVDVVLDDPPEYDPDPAMGSATITILDDDSGTPANSAPTDIALDSSSVNENETSGSLVGNMTPAGVTFGVPA